MKIGFFGTPPLAAKVLESLIYEKNIEVAFVVSNPDKPVGRKKTLTPTPVKLVAQEKNIDTYTPEKIRNNTKIYETVQSYACDYFVVVAYGKILPADFLDIPTKMCINVHGSLLPKYRGASPIQSALLDGKKETGVTIMQMSAGMDEGDMILKENISIDDNETTTSLFKKFEEVSPKALIEALQKLESGEIQPIPQDEKLATYCSKIQKEDGDIDWSESAQNIYQKWQAYTPWPGIYSFFEEKKIAFEAARFKTTGQMSHVEVGTVVECDGEVGVVCGQGLLIVEVVKLAGKQSQSIIDFVRGHQQFIGYVFKKKEE